MFNLSCISVFNNPIFLLCPRSPPCAPLVSFFFFRRLILFKEVFMDFLKRYKKMIALRGLTAHTMKSYCTYISAYLTRFTSTPPRSGIPISSGFLIYSSRTAVFQIVPLIQRSLRYGFLLSMSFTTPGILLKSPCGNSTPISLLSLRKMR